MKPGFGYRCKVQKLEECHTDALSLSYNRCTLTIRSKPTHLRNPACPSTPPTIPSSTFVLESLKSRWALIRKRFSLALLLGRRRPTLNRLYEIGHSLRGFTKLECHETVAVLISLTRWVDPQGGIKMNLCICLRSVENVFAR